MKSTQLKIQDNQQNKSLAMFTLLLRKNQPKISTITNNIGTNQQLTPKILTPINNIETNLHSIPQILLYKEHDKS